MIEVTIDKQIRFDLPEGWFESQITGLKPSNKQTAKGTQPWCRINFEVEVPGMRDYDCRAGRNFQLSLKPGSDLRNFVLPVLGAEFFTLNSCKTVNLEAELVGMRVLAQLRHYHGDGYEKPLTIVEQIKPQEQLN